MDQTLALCIIAICVVASKALGAACERRGQVALLGEIFTGLILAIFAFFGLHGPAEALHSTTGQLLAEIGIDLLLFKIGLELDFKRLSTVKWQALMVACLGVCLLFASGYLLTGWITPRPTLVARIFLGGALTATSVAIGSRTMVELKIDKTPAAAIVFAASVIDDVLGLLVLSVATSVQQGHAPTLAGLGTTALKAVSVLGLSMAVDRVLAKRVNALFSRIKQGVGMKTALVLGACFLYAYLAKLGGLAPIVGAFAAGLMLDKVHFKGFHRPAIVHHLIEQHGRELSTEALSALREEEDRHIEDLVSSFSRWFTPIFFIGTGAQLNLRLCTPTTLMLALILTVIVIGGKAMSGLLSGKGNRLVVGIGMMPHGEVSLIFAEMGHRNHVFNDQVFGAIILMVVATTVVTPPLLTWAVKRQKK